MKLSIINKSRLERTFRLDADYYQSGYTDIEKVLLQKQNVYSIIDICKVSDGNHMSIAEHFNYENGIPYYRGQDITDFFLENVSPVYISREIFNFPMMKRSHFNVGDVLVSIVGTIGNLSLVTNAVIEATGSCKIAILRQ